MADYTLALHPAAKKELFKLDHQSKVFVIEALDLFIEAYDLEYEVALLQQSKIKRLKGKWQGFYRLRLRNYRGIYGKINDQLVIHIVRVAHRKEAY